MIGAFATGLCVFVAFIVICMLIIRVGSHEEEPLVVEHIAFGAGAAALLYAVFFTERKLERFADQIFFFSLLTSIWGKSDMSSSLCAAACAHHRGQLRSLDDVS